MLNISEVACRMNCRITTVKRLNPVLDPDYNDGDRLYSDDCLDHLLEDWDNIPWPMPYMGLEDINSVIRWRNRQLPDDPRPEWEHHEWKVNKHRRRVDRNCLEFNDDDIGQVTAILEEALDYLEGYRGELTLAALKVLEAATTSYKKERDDVDEDDGRHCPQFRLPYPPGAKVGLGTPPHQRLVLR